MGMRTDTFGLPERWVVRKGEPCAQTLAHGGAVGLHDYMETVGSAARWCMWCGRSEDDRGPGWTVLNPTHGVFYYADYSTAVRHASIGWHNSLDPMQRTLYLTIKNSRVLHAMGLLDD